MRWLRFWAMASAVYVTPLALLVLAHPTYQTWANALVILGPPVVALVACLTFAKD
jgi:hypothetical protein